MFSIHYIFLNFQLESAIGKGKDVPIKDTVPYSFIAKEDVSIFMPTNHIPINLFLMQYF